MAKKRTTGKKGEATLDASTRICVITGPEQMKRAMKFAELRHALEAEHGEIDPIVFDGERAELAQVLDELRTFGLLQAFKLVVVDPAEDFVKKHRQALERYAESPVDSATLVLRADRWHAGNLDKRIKKVGEIVKCDAPTPEEADRFVRDRAKVEHGKAIEPAAAALLVQRVGCHLMKLDSELGKLALMAEGGGTITADLVRQAVGRGSDEQAWVIQEAILGALLAEAPSGGTHAGPMLEKVHELITVGRQPEVVVLWAVGDMCRKLHLAWQMKGQGMNDFAIGKALRIWPRARQDLFRDVMKLIDARAARRLFDRAIDRDARSKSGHGEPRHNVEGFCAEIAAAV